jgi:hypothetical protein
MIIELAQPTLMLLTDPYCGIYKTSSHILITSIGTPICSCPKIII